MPQVSRNQLILSILGTLVVLALGLRYFGSQQASRSPAGDAATAPRGVRIDPPTDRGELVHVAGAVRRPGVYRLGAGARVQDAVRRAGGAGPRGDLNAINLAGKVSDGQQIVVPERGASGTALASSAVEASRSSTRRSTSTARPPSSSTRSTAWVRPRRARSSTGARRTAAFAASTISPRSRASGRSGWPLFGTRSRRDARRARHDTRS